MTFQVTQEEKEKLALAIYEVNCVAKLATKTNDRKTKRYCYYLKGTVLTVLYNLGEVEILGYHVMYHIWDKFKPCNLKTRVGVVLRIKGTAYMFHHPVWYERIEKLELPYLGRMEDVKSQRNICDHRPTLSEAKRYIKTWYAGYQRYIAYEH